MGDAGPPTPIPVIAQEQNEFQSSTSNEHVRDIHVLVTGFGPFKTFYINPSWLIASNLPATLEPAPITKSDFSPSSNQIRPPNCQPYRIVVHTHPSAIHVSYNTVASSIPTLLSPTHNSTGIDYDYILHIGLASGRDSYTLETCAHRDFYKLKDVEDKDGTIPGEMMWKAQGIPERIDVGWDAQDVLTRWTRMVDEQEDALHPRPLPVPQTSTNRAPSTVTADKRAVVKLSKDAGRFLCEFILMCSLAERWRAARDSTAGSPAAEKRGKVAFLHVPNGIAAPDVARGTRVAEAAIRAFVASWEDGYRNPLVYRAASDAVVTGTEAGAFEAKSTGDA